MAGRLEKRGKGWRLIAYGGYKNGKQVKHYKTIGAVSEKEASKQLARWVTEIDKKTTYDPDHLTFADFCRRWVTDYAEINLAPRTVHRYKELLETIIYCLGELKLSKIKPSHIIEYESILREDGARRDGKEGGLGDRTIMHHHRLLSSIFQTAVYWQILESNPVKKIKPPKVEKKAVKSFTHEEMLQIIKDLNNAPLKHKLAILLGFGTGIRKGELLALTWDNLDLENKILTVEHTLLYIPNQELSLTKPKTEESKRNISIPSYLIPLLKEYKEKQKEFFLLNKVYPELNLVFTANDGNFMYPTTITKWFKKFLQDRELPELGYHGLRHTYITLLLNSGVPTGIVSKSAGHSRPSTTTDIYYSYFKQVDTETANQMDKLMQKD